MCMSFEETDLFNWKITIRRTLSGAIFVVAGLAGCSQTSLEEHLSNAVTASKNGDIAASVIELKNVLQEAPDHVEARSLLARNYLDMGYGAAAESELRKIEAQSKSNPAFVQALADAILSAGKFQEVLDYTEELSPALILAGIHAARSEAYVGLGDYQNAEAALGSITDPEAGDARVLSARAILAAANGQIDSAVAYAKQSQQAAPYEPRSYIVEGRIQIDNGEFAAAERAFRAAVERVPARVDAHVGITRALLGQRKAEEAKKLAGALAKQYPSALVPVYLRGLANAELGDLRGARDDMREVLSIAPEHLGARFLLAQLLLAEQKTEQAEELIATVVRDAPGARVAREVYAAVLLHNGKPDEAIATYEDWLADQEPTTETLELLGAVYIEAGRVDEGLERFERAMALAPDNTKLVAKVAAARFAANDIDGAADLVEHALETGVHTRRNQTLELLVALRRGEFSSVAERAAVLVEQAPDDPAYRFLLGSANLSLGELEKAKEHLRAATSLDPKFTSAVVGLAQIANLEGNEAGELAMLEKAAAVDPNNLQVLLPLARAKANSGALPEAVAILERVREAHPKFILAQLTLARSYVTAKQFSKALEVANQAYALSPTDPSVLLVRGYAQLGTGDAKSALETLNTASRLLPESPNIHYAVAAAAYRLGRKDLAEAALNKSLELNENSIQGLLTLAELEASTGASQNALRLTEKIKEKFPKSPSAHVLEGDIFAASGKQDKQAREAYERALELGAGSNVLLRYYKLQMRGGNHREAIAGIERWLTENSNDPYGNYLLARAYQEAGDPDAAISAYERLLQIDGKNIAALNNLANIYYEAGDHKAVQFAKKAYALSPTDPGVADTLGWILLNTGESIEGEKLLVGALESFPGSPTIRYHVAAAKVRNGDKPAAIVHLRKALETGSFPEHAAAKKLLERLAR